MDESARQTIGYYDANAASYVADTPESSSARSSASLRSACRRAAASSTWAAGRAATPSHS